MGVRGYSFTVIVTGIVLTPLVAIIKDGWPLGVILLWITCGLLAYKSYFMVDNSARELHRKYIGNPGAYLPPKFALKMGLVNLVPRKEVEIPKTYQMDRFVYLATQHVIIYDLKYRKLDINKWNYCAVVELISGGVYQVDNYGIYRMGDSSVGEIEEGIEQKIGADCKRVYVCCLENVPGKLKHPRNPYWQNRNTTAEKSKFINYYDKYKYDAKKYHKVDFGILTDENVDCTKEASADYK